MTSNNDWYRPDGSQAISGDERVWAMLAHLSAPISMVISAGWLPFLGPLVIWALQKDRSPFVRSAAAQSFNFNIGMTIMSIAGWISFFTLIGIPVAIILWALAFILTIWHHVKATLAASNDKLYSYPFQIRILS